MQTNENTVESQGNKQVAHQTDQFRDRHNMRRPRLLEKSITLEKMEGKRR